MFNRLQAHNGVFRLPPIVRNNEKELDQAIKDLEERGFQLVRRGTKHKEVKDFEYKQSSKTPKTYKGTTEFNSVWAIMEKR